MYLQSLQECSDGEVVVQAYEKVVYFIRHGQSFANLKSMRERESDQALRDSVLTRAGAKQAENLQKVVEKWDVQMVLTSPMTRCIQTACITFAKQSKVPLIAWPLLTECHPQYPECQGRLKEELLEDPRLTDLERFKDVALENAIGEWWSIASDLTRVYSFLAWLRACPMTRIAVVGHSNFLQSLLKAAHYGGELSMHNCTWITTVWHPAQRDEDRDGSDDEKGKGKKQYSVWLVPDYSTRIELLEELKRFYIAVRSHSRLSKASFLSNRRDVSVDELFHVVLTDPIPLGYDDLHRLTQSLQLGVGTLLGKVKSGTYSVGCESGTDQIKVKIDEGKRLHARVVFSSPLLAELSQHISKLPCFKNYPLAVRQEFRATIIADIASVVEEITNPKNAVGAGRTFTPRLSQGPHQLPADESTDDDDEGADGADADEDVAAFDRPYPRRRFSLALRDFNNAMPIATFPLLSSCLHQVHQERIAARQLSDEKLAALAADLKIEDKTEPDEEPTPVEAREAHNNGSTNGGAATADAGAGGAVAAGAGADDGVVYNDSPWYVPEADPGNSGVNNKTNGEWITQFSSLRWTACIVSREGTGLPKREPGLNFKLWH
ncbi:unnamed protein product [Chrysoparadoxa australica]